MAGPLGGALAHRLVLERSAVIPTTVALVPMRSGSKRVRNKNIKPLAGHPLCAYAIASALESGVFSDVLVSTDSEEYAAIARRYGAWVPFLAGLDGSCHTDTSPDIAWVDFTLRRLREMGREWDAFAILRPTNPFRTAETIRRAYSRWLEKGAGFDSLRAVERTPVHPYKQFRYDATSSRLVPLMEYADDWWKDGAPGHSRQYQSLPPVYSQNASLEIAWTKTVFEKGSIAGDRILPFFSEGLEGFDINNFDDYDRACRLVESGQVVLPGGLHAAQGS